MVLVREEPAELIKQPVFPVVSREQAPDQSPPKVGAQVPPKEQTQNKPRRQGIRVQQGLQQKRQVICS